MKAVYLMRIWDSNALQKVYGSSVLLNGHFQIWIVEVKVI